MVVTPPPHPMFRLVCYSGGHSSGLVAVEVARRYGTKRLILLNHDINSRVEDADIKRFKQSVAEYIGVPVTYANMPGWETMDQFDVVMDEGAFKVGTGTALCTSRLKTWPFEAYLKATFSRGNCVIYYGFDKDEPRRIQRRAAHLSMLGYRTDFPLAMWHVRTIHSTREIGIDPPNTYAKFKHANCVGCLKAGRQHWYVVFCTRSDVWEKAKATEKEIGYTIINGISLAQLEPLFQKMRCAGVEPTEHVPQQKFWAHVRALGLDAEEQPDVRPCECVI